ncbi:MAG: hypothetical protein WC898_00080 [Candidatus Paceibacterota bacterium]|jgi:hypothetical protein
MQPETRKCQNCNKDFTIEPEDFSFYEKIKVPPPTFCPECRMQRRFTVRNERNLYRRECNLCKKQIVSMYSTEKKFPVYCQTCWWGDKWDPLLHGRKYDFSKPFFLQFIDLQDETPRPALIVPNSLNCDYCNHIADGKNSYLCFGSIAIEDCMYGSPYESKNCVDNYVIRESEYCYECIDCEKMSHSIFSQECSNSLNLTYCFDCKNCQDCIGCVGIRGKKYHVFNTPYSKEEYQKKNAEMLLNNINSLEKVKERFYRLKKSIPHKFAVQLQCKNVSGNNIIQSKNTFNCFDVKKCENIKYSKQIIDAKDASDINYCEFLEMAYEYIGYWKINSVMFSNIIGDSNKITYSDFCSASSNLFGSIAIRSKSYCILNKQYTKEEYEELVPKIIKHMNDMPYIDSKGRIYKYGEFFPPELSPFCYNETIAQEYFPLTKEEAIKQGYRWKEKEPRNYQIDINNGDIPDDINDVDESIIGKVIECKNKGNEQTGCTEAFKIIPDEYQFYKRMNLPISRFCPNCRHYNRLKQRNPMKLWHRQCMKEGCKNEFETSYAPDRPEIVYCEGCYNKEVY